MRKKILTPIIASTMMLAPTTIMAQIVEKSAGEPVKTQSGLISGVTQPSGIRTWLGVPFAEPPVRELRWRDPQPRQKWQGIWNADRVAPECIQPLRGRSINHYFGEEATSEDCLYLNIWAPPQPAPAGKPYPVIVWIYGGAFNVGSASMANYSGEKLATEGVVYVALSYRVGPLGFLAHPDLTREGNGGSGNYGLKDQIAGLQWVKDNIAGFGGDPNNVTIAGQSAGSMSVALLQSSPATKGLFQRVMGMSGSPFGELMAPAPLSKGEEDGLALQKALGAQSIEDMRDIPADRLIDVAVTVPRQPVILDGKILQHTAQDSFANQQQQDVPVMLGFTRDESFLSFGQINSVADYEAAIGRAFPDNAARILKAYPARSTAEAKRAIADIQRDSSLGSQMANWAEAQFKYGKAAVYPYFFTRVQPYSPGVRFTDHNPETAGSYHSADVPYWLGTLDSLNRFRSTRNWTAQDRQLSQQMMDALLSFARTGAPGKEWPRFSPSTPEVRQLGETSGKISWPNFKALPLLQKAKPVSATPAQRPQVRD